MLKPGAGTGQILTACIRPDTHHFLAPNIVRIHAYDRTCVTFEHRTLYECMYTSGHASLRAPNIVRTHVHDRTHVTFCHQTLSDFVHATGHASLSRTKLCPNSCMRPDMSHCRTPNIVRILACDRTCVTFQHQTLSEFMHTTGHASLSSTKHCPNSCIRPDTRHSRAPNFVRIHAYDRTRVTF